MSNIWFCSDLHIGHKNIGSFRGSSMGIHSEEDNRESFKGEWTSTISKRDTVYFLGDIIFNREALDWFKENIPRCTAMYLVRGNHDDLTTKEYLEVFDEVYGIKRYKKYWLTHAPLHPDELRGRVNLHGHVHPATIKVSGVVDERYLNCCPENLKDVLEGRQWLINLNEIKDIRS